MKKIINSESILFLLALFLFAFLVLFVRNPDPVLTNILYAEDGSWTGLLISNGFLKSLWIARPDYFVFLNLALLQISIWINKLAFGYDFGIYPRVVAFVSYAFFAGAAVIAWYSMKNYLSQVSRIIIYFSIILVPLQGSANEVIGRLVNIGFILPVVLISILAIRENLNRLKKILVDFAILLISLTNPICIGITFVYFTFKFYFVLREKNKTINIHQTLKKIITSLLVIALLTSLIAARYIWLGTLSDLAKAPLVVSNLFEIIVARSIIFPLVLPFYRHTSNLTAVIGLIFFLSIFFIGYYSRLKSDYSGRLFGLAIFFALITLSFTIVAMRPGLTNFIGNYSGTYPDRYFMGQYLLSVLVIAWSFDGIIRRWSKSQLFYVTAITSLISLLIFLPWLRSFEFYESRFPMQLDKSFKESITLEYIKNPSINQYRIPIYPEGWFIDLPSEYVKGTALSKGK